MKNDVCGSIINMLTMGVLDEDFGDGDTIISLIPKISCLQKLDEFGPISLCNVTGKIVNRLKLILP